MHDLEQGIQGTDAKAAFLKVAADEPGVNEHIEKLHRAAARASVQTGAPIIAHSRPASNTGPRQVEIFLEEGVAPEKIQIAHTGDTDDLDYINGLLDAGVWIGLDRYGIEMYLPMEQRKKTLMALLEQGHDGPHPSVPGLRRGARLVPGGDRRAADGGRRGQGLVDDADVRAGASRL